MSCHPFLRPEHDELQRQVARFVAAEIEPHALAWDEAGATPRELLRKMGALGWRGRILMVRLLLPVLLAALAAALPPARAQSAAAPAATAQPLPALPSPAETRMPLPLADGSQIGAHWYPLPLQADGAPRPAVVALHGCGGLWRSAADTGQRFEARYPEYIARLHAAGFHVLLPDSFSARGSGSICMQKDSERSIKVETRRADVAAAVAWLATQPSVDAQRIVVLGWSHGGSTTLASIDAGRAGAAQPVAAAVVFYPGCGAWRRAPYSLRQPLLMLLGAADDWTPPAPCEQLAERLRREQGADITLRVYADSYHGFDSTAPLRFRAGVPNGTQPGGVHQGGNLQARAAAFAELDAFLARVRESPRAASQ